MKACSIVVGASLLLGAVGLAGCGYRFSTVGERIPADARTVGIALFENDTRERGLEVALQRAIEEEFRRRGGLRVVDTDPDLVLEGTIQKLRNVPVAFTGANEAVEFQGRMMVGVRLRERRNGTVLMRAARILEVTDFAATPDIFISSSPVFQQQTADARDLANLTNVTLTEGSRRRARERLVEQMAEQVYLRTVEAF